MQFLVPYVKISAPNLPVVLPGCETLPHPGFPAPSTYVSGIQDKFENGDAVVLRYLVGQGLWDALNSFNKSNVGENGAKKVSCRWYSITGRPG